jgi:mannose-6-phosphate isomerase-like protein (cupin superfamily)
MLKKEIPGYDSWKHRRTCNVRRCSPIQRQFNGTPARGRRLVLATRTGKRLRDDQDLARKLQLQFSLHGHAGYRGGRIREEHWHAKHEEILFCYEGQGEVLVDGTAHPFTPGTTVFVGRWVRRKIVNRGPGYLKITWTYLPPGLDTFLRSIGAERTPGEPEPTPFKRPAHTLEIKRTAGFGPKIGD